MSKFDFIRKLLLKLFNKYEKWITNINPKDDGTMACHGMKK